jgi:DNA-binding MarR family transcriptional regulator
MTANLLRVLLANRPAIGPAFWELAWIMCAESDQISITKIAAGLGKTRRSVAGNLRHLEEQQIIRRRYIPGQANRYTVQLSE